MTTVTLETETGDLVLTGATRTDDDGGWNSPDHRTERGFDYDSYVDREPIEVTVEARATEQQVEQIRNLRELSEPVEASVGELALASASIENVSVSNDGQEVWDRDLGEWVPGFEVTIDIEEVREATLETAEISIETEAGAMGSAAAEQDASTSYSEEDSDGGIIQQATDGVVDTLSGARESLSGVF